MNAKLSLAVGLVFIALGATCSAERSGSIPNYFSTLDLSPGGHYLLYRDNHGIGLQDLVTSEDASLPEFAAVQRWCFSPNGDLLATSSETNLTLWRTDTVALLRRLQEPSSGRQLAMSRGGEIVAALDRGGGLWLWFPFEERTKEIASAIPGEYIDHRVAISADGSLLAVGGPWTGGCRFDLWDVARGKLLRTIQEPVNGRVRRIRFLHGNTVLCAWLTRGTARAWDISADTVGRAATAAREPAAVPNTDTRAVGIVADQGGRYHCEMMDGKTHRNLLGPIGYEAVLDVELTDDESQALAVGTEEIVYIDTSTANVVRRVSNLPKWTWPWYWWALLIAIASWTLGWLLVASRQFPQMSGLRERADYLLLLATAFLLGTVLLPAHLFSTMRLDSPVGLQELFLLMEVAAVASLGASILAALLRAWTALVVLPTVMLPALVVTGGILMVSDA